MNTKAIVTNNIETTNINNKKLNTENSYKQLIQQANIKEIIKQKLFNIPFNNKELLYSPNDLSESDRAREYDNSLDSNTLSKWEGIINKLSEEDLEFLFEEGVPFEDYEISQLESAIERIKENKVKRREDLEKQVESHKRKLEAVRDTKGGTKVEKQIIKKLENMGLDITKENIERISNALEMAVVIPNISDSGVGYLLNNSMSFTINNLYKASFISSPNEELLNNTSETYNKIPEEILDQVKSRIVKANLEVSEDNLNNAAWLIKEDIPLTEENLWMLKDIKLIKEEMDLEKVLDRLVDSLDSGIRLEDTDLSVVIYDNLNKIIEEFKGIDSTYLEYLERSPNFLNDYNEIGQNNIEDDEEKKIINIKELDLSLREIKSAVERFEKGSAELNQVLDSYNNINISTITLRRNLEEIRLKLTLESGKQLIKNGFNFETDKLSSIVEGLRNIEDNYYNNLLKETNLSVNEKNLSAVKGAVNGFNLLKDMPASVLASTLTRSSSQTAKSLLEEGNKHITNYDLANKSYEKLMTRPDRYYGDRIEKAFENIEDILEELNLEKTEGNKRAVRILGYNELEINIENINNIKLYDSQINYMLKSINPHLVASFIKRGINPLDMPIEDLNRQIKEDLISSDEIQEEKFSKYLWKLEKNNEISQEDKEAYIGIYRLINQLYKNGEAALGAVIKASEEVSLKNLLTAIRTINKGQVDFKLDKDFGMLEDYLVKDQKIDMQINEGYINKIYDSISPEKLYQLDESDIDNMPLEDLSERLDNIPNDKDLEYQYYRSRLEEIEKNSSYNNKVIKYLESIEMPITLSNIEIALKELTGEGNFYTEWKKIIDSYYSDLNSNERMDVDYISNKLISSFNSSEEVKASYETIEASIKDRLRFLLEHKVISSKDARSLGSLSKTISYIKSLSEREHYQVPIATGETVTNVNLTILRSSEEKGKVTVNVPYSRLGYVTMQFQVKNEELSGLITCDNIESLNNFKANKEELLQRISRKGLECKYIYYSLEKDSSSLGRLDNLNPQTNLTMLKLKTNIQEGEDLEDKADSIEDSNENNSLVQTNLLYELSKEVLIYIRELEKEVE